MTPDDLVYFGELLYGGNRVASNLSHGLEVNARTIRRWMTGELPIPDGVEGELKKMLVAKHELLTELLSSRESSHEEAR